MKKTQIFIWVFSLLTVLSCTKERLVIQERELQFDENSPEYQTYQAERAMEYIRLFRFEKLDDIFDKLNDPAFLKNLQDSLRKYRSIAETQALYVVTPDNDSLFFIPPANDNPTLGEEIWLGTNFLANFTKMPNARGVVQGFKNYPKTTLFHFYNHLGTGLKGLEEIPELKSFRWMVDPADVVKAYPNQEFEYVPLQADLSQNHKLEEIIVSSIQLGNIIFPKHQLKSFSNSYFGLGGGVKMPTGSLDGLWSEVISAYGEADADFKMENVKTDHLTFYATVKTFDASRSEIKSLNIPLAEKLILGAGIEDLVAAPVERSTLPEGLRVLSLDTRNLKEGFDFPQSLKKLDLKGYAFDLDFSDLTQLDTLDLTYDFGYIGDNPPYPTLVSAKSLSLPTSLKHLTIGASGLYKLDVDGAVFPPSLQLQSIYCSKVSKGTWDLSHLSNLKEIVVHGSLYDQSGNVDLRPPSGVEKIVFSSSALTNNTLDLSICKNIKHLNIIQLEKDNPITLILPANLSEMALINASSQYGNNKPINLKTGSTIVNKPSWFDQYVAYY